MMLVCMDDSALCSRLQELTVCSEDTVDVHDIELIQYINVDCAKLKKLLQGTMGTSQQALPS